MKITSTELFISAVRQSQYPEDNLPEFLIVGRSNVGKSSFVNTLINRKNFARTSSKPGKTQTLNFYKINKDFYFVDVPGYGYAIADKKTQMKFGKMIEDYVANRKELKEVFMLVDFRHKPTSDDILMYNYLKYYNLKVTVIATKIDKISFGQREKYKNIILKTLDLKEGDNLILFSSVTKDGKKDVYNTVEKYLDFIDD
ncbi:MAG: YihA family ribosome biogenesis GTP-binding protein [Bacilli bacterium]|nr:YihA family ribosome biogenesis GTP-binding protein [Bacilli bacterium]MBQ6282756.1 YihA family ribosome biogenesis GTP-binding protein [Bacilli bacterium]